jgi:hypothetical protein
LLSVSGERKLGLQQPRYGKLNLLYRPGEEFLLMSKDDGEPTSSDCKAPIRSTKVAPNTTEYGGTRYGLQRNFFKRHWFAVSWYCFALVLMMVTMLLGYSETETVQSQCSLAIDDDRNATGLFFCTTRDPSDIAPPWSQYLGHFSNLRDFNIQSIIAQISFLKKPLREYSVKSLFSMSGKNCAAEGFVTSQSNCLDFDKIIDNLNKGNVAVSTPETMRFTATESVWLIVSRHIDEQHLAAKLESTGGAVETQMGVPVSRRMVATLESGYFSIDPAEPITKTLSPAWETEWIWYITPKKAGEQFPIKVSLYALVQLDDDKTEQVPIQSFSKTVEVEVTWFDRTILLMQAIQPIYVIPAGVVAGLWVLFVYWRNKSGSNGTIGRPRKRPSAK